MFPPRTSFDASWFIDGKLVPLVDRFFPAGWSARRRKPAVHVDNPPAQNSRVAQNPFGHTPPKRLSHPSHSLGTSPSDFYLFAKVKGALIGRKIPDEIELLKTVTDISNRIADAELRPAFRG
jgi:hypothetical protein